MSWFGTEYADRRHMDPSMSQMPPQVGRGGALEAASEAASRINALLIAQGALKPSQVSALPTKSKPVQQYYSTPLEVRTFVCKVPNWASSSTFKNKIIAEVDINGVLPAARSNLTRSSTHEEIVRLSGIMSVTSKGRFMYDYERMRAEPGDRPLYLVIESATQEAIDRAVARIQELVDGKDVRKDCWWPPDSGFSAASSGSGFYSGSSFGAMSRPMVSDVRTNVSTSTGMSPSMSFMSDKLIVGLEHAPLSFDVRGKLLGPGGSYLQHIMNETLAKVMLRGRGSGFIEPEFGREAYEPMYIFIQHQAPQGLQLARELSQSLIETVQQQYAEFQRELASMPPPMVSTATLLAGLQPPTQMGLTLVGTSLPSSLSVMPVAATIGPPGLLNPGHTVLLDTSLPPPGGTHFQPGTSQPITIDGSLMSVQPTTSFVLSQPQQGPPPGSLVLTHQPDLASGTIVLSQPVVSGPPDSYVLGPPGPAPPGSFVLTQPAPAPGTLVLSQPGAPFIRQQLVLQSAIETEPQEFSVLGPQAGTTFSQAGGASRSDTQPHGVSIYQIPSGSQLTVMQPPPGSMHESGGSGGPSAIYTLSLPAHSSTVTTSQQNSTTMADSKQRTGPRKRRFNENDDVDFGNLLGYQHGPPHLMNTLTTSAAAGDMSTSLASTMTTAARSTFESSDAGDNSDVAGSSQSGQQAAYNNAMADSRGQMETDMNNTACGGRAPDGFPASQCSGQPQMYPASPQQSQGDPNFGPGQQFMPGQQLGPDVAGQQQQMVQQFVQQLFTMADQQQASFMYQQPQFQPQPHLEPQHGPFVAGPMPPPPPSSFGMPASSYGGPLRSPMAYMSEGMMQQRQPAMGAPPPPPPPPPSSMGLAFPPHSGGGFSNPASGQQYWMIN